MSAYCTVLTMTCPAYYHAPTAAPIIITIIITTIISIVVVVAIIITLMVTGAAATAISSALAARAILPFYHGLGKFTLEAPIT